MLKVNGPWKPWNYRLRLRPASLSVLLLLFWSSLLLLFQSFCTAHEYIYCSYIAALTAFMTSCQLHNIHFIRYVYVACVQRHFQWHMTQWRASRRGSSSQASWVVQAVPATFLCKMVQSYDWRLSQFHYEKKCAGNFCELVSREARPLSCPLWLGRPGLARPPCCPVPGIGA